MSRTDNTRPWDAQKADPTTLRFMKDGFEWLIAGDSNSFGGHGKEERKQMNRDRRQRDRLVVTMARRSYNPDDPDPIDVQPIRADRRCLNWRMA